MPTPRGFTLRSSLLLELLIKDRGHNYSSLARAVGRSKQLIAQLASGARDSCNAETADRLATTLEVAQRDLFLAKIDDESSTRSRVRK